MQIRGCLLALLLGGFSLLNGTEKTEQQVFEKWLEWQKCYGHPALDSVTQNQSDGYWNIFKKRCSVVCPKIKDRVPFLSWLTHGKATQKGINIPSAFDKQAKQNFSLLFNAVENDMEGFLKLLKQHGFYNEKINKQEKAVHFQQVIDKNVAFTKLLFARADEYRRDEYLFSFANHLFEFCFSPKTWPKFEQMLNDRSSDPLNRFVYSTMWRFLVGDGWHNWSNECLSNLRASANRGDELVYIAGGSDIYQLLKNGIYNMTIIDPQLPSQDTYYTDNWEWLVKSDEKNGGIGDRFTVKTDDGQLTVERVKYEENGSFDAELSTNKTVQLPLSSTIWNVYDDKKVYKGRVLFERRYCQHKDLLPGAHKTILFSFNEMFYAALGKDLGGWDVQPEALPESFATYVKQLRLPADTKTFAYIRSSEKSKFNFISLGSIAT